MREAVSPNHPLRRLFAGCLEQTFVTELGLCDPSLTDYLAELLTNFIHVDRIFSLRNAAGKQLEEVADMLTEAFLGQRLSSRQRQRFLHRHIGDFTLFWTGVYPEGLHLLRHAQRKDRLIDYVDVGKKSYAIVAGASQEDDVPPPRVYRRLAHEFEMCAYGLHKTRKTWEEVRARPS